MPTPHTPGPWGCISTSNYAHDYRLTQPDGKPLKLEVIANDHSEQYATARLISTAPKLLTLCYRALLALDEEDFPQLREDLRNVINQATGEQL